MWIVDSGQRLQRDVKCRQSTMTFDCVFVAPVLLDSAYNVTSSVDSTVTFDCVVQHDDQSMQVRDYAVVCVTVHTSRAHQEILYQLDIS